MKLIDVGALLTGRAIYPGSGYEESLEPPSAPLLNANMPNSAAFFGQITLNHDYHVMPRFRCGGGFLTDDPYVIGPVSGRKVANTRHHAFASTPCLGISCLNPP